MLAIRHPVGCYHREINGLFFFLSYYYLIFDFLCKNTKKRRLRQNIVYYILPQLCFFILYRQDIDDSGRVGKKLFIFRDDV